MSLFASTPPPAPAPVFGPVRKLRWSALGTVCEVQYECFDDALARRFDAAAMDWVESFEARYSRFRPDSLLSRINASAGGYWVAVDEEMDRMLDFCGALFQLSNGALDVTAMPLMKLWDYKAASPWLPSDAAIAAGLGLVGWSKVQRVPGKVRLPEPGMALDFGGWGKEYAVDAVASLAKAHGLTKVLVDFGHDMMAVGTAPGKPGWHVGLEDPAKPGGPCKGSLAAANIGVASSGDYLRGFTIDGRRYGHIIDPRNGRPVNNGCRQVTVVAPSCVNAGVVATVVFILGPAEGLRFASDMMGVEVRIVTEQAVHQTKGFYHYVVS